MTEVIDAWGIISGAIAVGAIAVAFRAELLVRVRVLEDKVQTLFELFNRKYKSLQPTRNPLISLWVQIGCISTNSLILKNNLALRESISTPKNILILEGG